MTIEDKRERLKTRIKKVFDRYKDCAAYLGITEVSLCNKLSGKAKFSKAEAIALSRKKIKIPEEFIR